jgi:putative nucleotidyltransferase with HDIG domain
MKIVSLERVTRNPASREPAGVFVYLACLVMGAGGLAFFLMAYGERVEGTWVVLALAIATAVAERWSVPLTTTTALSVYLLPTVFAAVVLGPLEAGLVAAASLLGERALFRSAQAGESPRLRWAVYTCTSFITGALAGLAAAAADSLVAGDIAGLIVATGVAMAVAEALDFVFVSLTAEIRAHRGRQVARAIASVSLTSFIVYTPIVLLLSLAFTTISDWTVPALLLPALAVQRLYGLYERERRLAEELTAANERLSSANETLARANLSFAGGLVATLDARDTYTAGHSAAVAVYSRDIAAKLSLSEDEQELTYLCGLVHDIGKIGLPAGLLEKPGALTPDEREEMKRHSEIGETILRRVDDYEDIARIVRHHHERIDGTGYPDGLEGASIPFVSRIIAVADAYNAMTSDRPYRDAMPYHIARQRLVDGADTQFDPVVVMAFLSVLSSMDESYRSAKGDDFEFFGEASKSPACEGNYVESVAEVA